MTQLNTAGKLTVRGDEGQFQELNLNHWLAVQAARIRQGLPRMCGTPVDALYVEGDVYVNKFTNRLYTLKMMRESWWGGRYLRGILESADGSSTAVVLHNRSSTYPDICYEEKAFLASYELHKPV